MSAATIFARSARHLVSKEGAAVTFKNGFDEITTNAVIAMTVDLLGEGVQMGESRYDCTLLVEDVGNPERGHTVTEADDTVWILQEKQPISDEWLEIWSIVKR